MARDYSFRGMTVSSHFRARMEKRGFTRERMTKQ
jgi:hypothetical protein